MNPILLIGSHLPEIQAVFHQLLADDWIPSDSRLALPLSCFPVVSHSESLTSYDTIEWDLTQILEAAPSQLFILCDPLVQLPDFMEAVAHVLKARATSPDRVLCMADMLAIEKFPEARLFYETAAWYADVMLLGNRQDASQKSVKKFKDTLSKACYPVLFSMIKADARIQDPGAVLFPESRRLSHLFDFAFGEEDTSVLPIIIEASCDLDTDSDPSTNPDPFKDSSDPRLPSSIPTAETFLVRD